MYLNKRVIFLIPEISLIDQVVQELEKRFPDKIAFFHSSMKATEHRNVWWQINANKFEVLVGPRSALFTPIDNVGLIIIDEQHKFGVKQRIELSNKGGKDCDILLMSATPIPRTLTMSIYGDMDVSIIREKPNHRKEIKTYSKLESKINDVINFVKNSI